MQVLALAGLCLSAVLMVAGSPAAGAAACDRFASPSGSDAGDGSLTSPYLTQKRLLASLSPGQTGCFRAGTYTFSEARINKANITLAPYGTEAVTLKGTLKVVPSGAGSTIEGMTLNGAGGSSNIGPRIYADRVVLRDNDITNRHTEICVTVSSYYSNPAPRGVVIERNRIHDCGELPRTNKDHGVYLSAARDTVIRDNWIYDNADRGIQQYPDVRGSVITGNVIDGNGQGVNFSGFGNTTSSSNVVEGNIISNSERSWNSYSGADGPVGTNNVVRKNCVFASNSNDYYNSNGGIETPSRNYSTSSNLNASPRFADAGADNFRLQSNSPCLAKYTGTMSSDATPPPDPADDPPDSGGDGGKVKLSVNRDSVRRGGELKLQGRTPLLSSSQPQRAAIQRRRNGHWRWAGGADIRGEGVFAKRLRARARHQRVLCLRAKVSGAGHSRAIWVRVRG